jgi:thiosulfate/3-mercaptopyruvate sulfurtransferase
LDGSFAVVDCRFDLNDPDWGEAQYRAGHIPGAVYAHLDRDLSGEKTGANGRHPLPRAASATETLGRLGIDRDLQVVAYDQADSMYASRLWWLLRWLGHEAVAVLDGGFAKWMAEGRPTLSGAEHRIRRLFRPALRTDASVTLREVIDLSTRPDWKLVDARAPERFRGDVETLDRIGGHIPDAVNHWYRRNVNERGTFLAPGVLREQFDEVLRQTPIDHVVCYCGSGVTACHNLLALEHAGLSGAKLYGGSWSEWSSDPARPVARRTD